MSQNTPIPWKNWNIIVINKTLLHNWFAFIACCQCLLVVKKNQKKFAAGSPWAGGFPHAGNQWRTADKRRGLNVKNNLPSNTTPTRNVGQCLTWWSPCQTWVMPPVQCRKVWLMPTTGLPCSNAAKTQKPLKLVGVPQTNEMISAASRPKFTILWGHVEQMLLRNKFFFPIVDMCLNCEDIAWQICAIVPRWRFFCIIFASCIYSEPCEAHFTPAF